MPQSLPGIDHVLLAVRDLDRARLGWERLGFTLTPLGRHIGRATANYCIMFGRDYIELLGIVDPMFPSRLTTLLARREGPIRLAFASGDLEASRADLARRGLHPGPAQEFARQLELPSGTALARFRTADLPLEETPALPSFVCQHQTPELVRQPGWLMHPNRAAGLLGVTVVTTETEPLRAAYERIFGADVVATDAVLTIHCGPHRISFVTPDDFERLYPECELPPGLELPAITALILASRDLDATADHLTQWQIAFDEAADGTLLVPPEEANGTLLVFRPA
jgi:hypothetical protein